MNIAFTLCSNNYLAHAKTLGDSFERYHSDWQFIIGLVDKFHPELDYSVFSKFTVIPVEELEIENFEDLNNKYNVVELNTAVKPSYYHYIFNKFKSDKLIYIDPDVLVLSRFNEVLELLNHHNIIVTPHICTPIDDEFVPTDYHTLRGGIFNLGFIALSNYEAVKDFLNWWHARVIKYGFANFALSMFYDQLWINYVPVFYNNYSILKHPGYNMANWNLHERYLSINGNGNYIVNGNFELRFFHFSSYKYEHPEKICSYFTRYTFTDRPDLVSIFEKYRNLLADNNIEVIKDLPIYYYPDTKINIKRGSLMKRTILRVGLVLKVMKKGYI